MACGSSSRVSSTADVRQRLGVSDPRQHLRGLGHSGVEGGLCLGDQATLDLAQAPPLKALVDHVEAGRETDAQRVERHSGPRAQAPERRTRGAEHLDGADHPHRVLKVDSRVRVKLQQALAERGGVQHLQLGSQRRVRRNAGQTEAIGQRVDIEHRAALDYRQPVARCDVRDRLSRASYIPRHVEARGPRVDEVDHVVAHSPPVLVVGLVGGDVQPFVNLLRVGDDDLACKLDCEVERKL